MKIRYPSSTSKYDVAFDPVNVTFFGFIEIMLEANNITNLFEQFFSRFFCGMILLILQKMNLVRLSGLRMEE